MFEFKKELEKMSKLTFSEDERMKFEDKMMDYARYYQKLYKFNGKDNFHNDEGDAFKHAFGSAYMVLTMGSLGGFAGGIKHEYDEEKNPPKELNMDLWNNRKGRDIAEEIKKEFTISRFNKFSEQEQLDIIAQRVIEKLKNGELIINPDDKRVYQDIRDIASYKITSGARNAIEEFHNHGFEGIIKKMNKFKQESPFGFINDLNNLINTINNSLKPEFNFDELMNNRMNDVNDINSIHNNEEKNVIETVLNKEKKKIKYRLRVSPWEILVFDTKEEFIDKVGEIIADELRQAVINRSYADGYFKPGRV